MPNFVAFLVLSDTAILFIENNFFSPVTESKLNAILFCSEVNSTGYSEIEEPISLRKKHYSTAKHMFMHGYQSTLKQILIYVILRHLVSHTKIFCHRIAYP